MGDDAGMHAGAGQDIGRPFGVDRSGLGRAGEHRAFVALDEVNGRTPGQHLEGLHERRLHRPLRHRADQGLQFGVGHRDDFPRQRGIERLGAHRQRPPRARRLRRRGPGIRARGVAAPSSSFHSRLLSPTGPRRCSDLRPNNWVSRSFTRSSSQRNLRPQIGHLGERISAVGVVGQEAILMEISC